MILVSKAFKDALSICGIAKYRLAQAVGIHPVTLSRLLSGWQPITKDDERLKKIAKQIGFPVAKIFEVKKI